MQADHPVATPAAPHATAAALPPDPPRGLNQAALDRLWQRTREQQDSQARDELICHYLPYARMVAATYYAKRYHDEIEFAEYMQLATLGMIEALDRFDPARGVQFKTFASHRMHGTIVDGLSCTTEKQQQIALRTRLKQDRLNSIKQATPAAQDPTAPTAKPAFGADKLLNHLAEVGIGLALAWLLEDTSMVQAHDDAADTRHIPYLQSLELKQLQERVRNLVDTLPSQQKVVIRCHYVQEIPFEHIATMLGLTKGRISQIHKQALNAMREKLKGRRSCDVAW